MISTTRCNLIVLRPNFDADKRCFSFLPDCCKQDMVLKRESHGCHCVYPIKLDIILLNVSTSPNWKRFLDEFAHQLGLQVSQIELNNFYVLNNARLNISMDITPHSGVSFSASDASAINSSLVMHKVKLDPSLVGDYKLLNMTWFKPPPPSQGNSFLFIYYYYLSLVNFFFSEFYVSASLQYGGKLYSWSDSRMTTVV